MRCLERDKPYNSYIPPMASLCAAFVAGLCAPACFSCQVSIHHSICSIPSWKGPPCCHKHIGLAMYTLHMVQGGRLTIWARHLSVHRCTRCSLTQSAGRGCTGCRTGTDLHQYDPKGFKYASCGPAHRLKHVKAVVSALVPHTPGRAVFGPPCKPCT